MTDPADGRSSLLDWATGLVSDPALRSRFAQEPRAVLREQGLNEVPPADLAYSLPQVTDSVAARLGTEVDAAAVSTADLLDGATPVDVLARQFGAATDLVVSAATNGSDAGSHDPGPSDHDHDEIDDVRDPLAATDGPPSSHPAAAVAAHLASETITMTTPTTSHGPSGDHTADLLTRLDGFFTEAESHGIPRPATPEEFLADYGPDALGRFFDEYQPGDRSGEDFRNYANELLSSSRIAPAESVTAPADTSPSPVVPPDPELDGLDDPVGATPAPTEDVRTPGTPQGQHELELEAQSHGYPSAQAYVSDAALTGGLRDSGLAWEPQNGNAAYGQLQNYMDAAAAQGVPVGDYAAQHHYSPEEIDAAYAAGGAGTDPGESFGGDTDLDDLGAGGPAPGTGFSSPVPGPDDPLIGWGDGTGGAGSAPAAGEADLDGFVSSTSGGGDGYVPHGDDPFSDMVEAGGGTMSPGVDLDFGSSSAVGGADGGGAESFDSFGSGGDSSDGVGSSSDGGSDFGSHADMSAPEPVHEDPGAHDATDLDDPGSQDATDGSSDHAESFD